VTIVGATQRPDTPGLLLARVAGGVKSTLRRLRDLGTEIA
jgi:hypothetical protein